MSNGLVQILDGNTFVVSDSNGDIEASLTDPTGLFSFDTRFLSKWVLTIDGQRLNALSVDDLQYFETRFFLVPGSGTVYVDAKLSVIRRRAVGNGFHEELTILNHDDKPVDLAVRIEAGSDFADLFEVKDALAKKGKYSARVERGRLLLGYERETFRRETAISATAPARLDKSGLTFSARIQPHGEWSTDLDVVTAEGAGGSYVRPKYARGTKRARPSMELSLEKWIADAPRLECDRDELKATYRRSLVDLAALRFSPPVAGGRSLPAAGLPWFMTMFGRDSIFTSLQALPFTPELAATTLRALGDWQGSRVDDFRDEDPGRILHEMRYGEMTAFEERPHSPYYGCADATPLFVVLLDEYERWTGDRKLVRELEHEARAALNWIDEYADLMGTGYIWYQRRNEKTGLENQCWKDSWDSISYRDGTLPGFPRATCELQGYAYDAKVRGARLARLVWKDAELADRLEKDAADLKRRFNRDFWVSRRRVLRPGPRYRREPGRCARVEQRPPALERHRRQVQGQRSRGTSDGTPALLRLGRPDPGRGRGTVQPDRLPRRHGLAVRQLVHRLGPATLRLQGGGGADRGRHPRCRRGLQRAAAGGLRRLRADGDEVSGAVPDRVQPAGLVDGHAAACCCGRCSVSSRSGTISSSTRRFPEASAIWSCSTSRAAGDGSTPSDVAAWTSRSDVAGRAPVRRVVRGRNERRAGEHYPARAVGFEDGCDSRARRGVPLRAGGRAPAEGRAEPADDLAGPADVARAARGPDDLAARHACAVHRISVPGRRARPRPSLGHPAAARHDRRLRAAARLLPDQAARGSPGGGRCGRDHHRARLVRLLRRPGRRERERAQLPVGDHDRPALGALRPAARLR